MSTTAGGRQISHEVLQSRHLGTGHGETTRHEWATQQHRDTYATHVGHHDQLAFVAVAQNQSLGRVKADLLEKMLQPCGPPLKKADDQ